MCRTKAALLIILCLVLGACTGPQAAPPPAPTATPAPPKGPVEIEFWRALTGDYGKVLEDLIKEYNASQTAVTVKDVYAGNYQESQKRLMAALAAGQAPDVMQLEVSFSAQLVANRTLVPMQNFIDGPKGLSKADKEDIYPGFWKSSTVDNVIWTMPYNNSMPVLYYNADMLEAANVKPPETWQDLTAACKAIGAKGQLGFTINPGNIWVYEAMVWQNKGELFSPDYKEVRFNQPAAVEALQYWVDLVKSGCAKMQSWDEGRTEFFVGKAAFLQDSSAGLVGYIKNSKFKLGVTHLPWGKSQVATIGGANLGIFASVPKERQEAAWDFVKFLTSKEGIARLSAGTGYLPVRKSATDVPVLADLLKQDPRAKVSIDSLPYAVPRPNVTGYAEIQTFIREAIESSLLGKASAQEALNAAAEKTKTVLAKP